LLKVGLGGFDADFFGPDGFDFHIFLCDFNNFIAGYLFTK
jgi:hypothetical protein